MLKIKCTGCQKMLPVDEAHAGKWIRCRGCGTAVQVPGGELGTLPAATVDANDASAVRRMNPREFKKKRKGDSLAGASGLCLDGADAGGSAAGASGSFAGMSGSFAGLDLDPSVPATQDSQSQMWELKELNRQRAEGAITKATYRERKTEIMAGRSLAVQAMSRSADGVPTRSRVGKARTGPVLPGPIRALLVVAVLGIVAFILWNTVLKSDPEQAGPASQSSTSADPAPPPANLNNIGAPKTSDPSSAPPVSTAGTVSIPRSSQVHQNPDAIVPPQFGVTAFASLIGFPDPLEVNSSDLAQATASVGPDGVNLGPRNAPTVSQRPNPGSTAVNAPTRTGATPEADDPNATVFNTPSPRGQVTAWPVLYPDYSADVSTAIGQACSQVKQMIVGDETALIGVAAGPKASGLDDPGYVAYCAEMQQVLMQVAVTDGIFDDLVFRPSDRPKRYGTLIGERLYVEHRTRRDAAALILTGVQDGYCVSYWFAGARRLVPDFFDTVGSAIVQASLSE